jgi:flavin-binding protein dodecin
MQSCTLRAKLAAGEPNEMAGTYNLLELVGTSPISFAEATKAAIAEASKSVRHMDWFEVVQERESIADGQVQEFQVTLKVGFKIER